MNKFLIRSLYTIIILPIYFVIIFLIFLITFEFFGISKLINDKIVNIDKAKFYLLEETDYYMQGGISYDPYYEFIRQILHPTYFFSMHWDIEKIKKINNPFVSLNNSGFRNSLNFENKKNGIVVLGGSTAFSHGSSSDNTSISSFLSKKTKYNSINRAAPSWNSHQEMLSLIEYKNDYDYVISLSSSNDFALTCSNSFYYSKIFDIPESFILITDYFYDIRDKSILNFSQSLKKFLIHTFPETKKIYKHIKFTLKKTDNDNTTEVKEISRTNFCGGLKNIDKLVENFLYNQNIIRTLAYHNNAEHWLVIQPQSELHYISDFENKKTNILLRKYYTDKIMSSSFCKIKCLDYSNLYDQVSTNDFILIPDKKKINWHDKAIFIDNYHLTDLGNEILVDNLINDIEFK